MYTTLKILGNVAIKYRTIFIDKNFLHLSFTFEDIEIFSLSNVSIEIVKISRHDENNSRLLSPANLENFRKYKTFAEYKPSRICYLNQFPAPIDSSCIYIK